ncbi:MAG: hypothetical protein D6782_04325 [Alphaproteobacteria bacterium]|nr:MAG: hypothetical protein D6782_04325 [Alphaproteobacteria bacterium]
MVRAMSKHAPFTAWLVATALAIAAPPALAGGQNDQDEALRAMRAGDIMPYNKVKRRVESQVRGTVIGQSAPRQVNSKRWVYEFRVLVDNRVERVIVDARTGRLIER